MQLQLCVEACRISTIGGLCRNLIPNHPRLSSPANQGCSIKTLGIAWLIVFIFAAIFYGLSASPDIQWQDSGQFADTVTGKMDVDFGLCTAHPLHFWLCLVHLLDSCQLQRSLACAWVSAAQQGNDSIANVFGVVRTLTNDLPQRQLAALGLMVAHSFWRFSCYTKCTASLRHS